MVITGNFKYNVGDKILIQATILERESNVFSEQAYWIDAGYKQCLWIAEENIPSEVKLIIKENKDGNYW